MTDPSTPAGGSSEGPLLTRSDPEQLVGKQLGGRYEVQRFIGRGGMGVVYLARQRALDRDVVIKVLPRALVDEAEALARFEREAVGMSRLQHPHIVSVYDFGREDDLAYICMEYVDGETLQSRIKRRAEPMDISTFGSIAMQILEGISEAHSMGMIHRDLKPANIMLAERRGQQNYVKILDFGLAKLVAGAQDVTSEQKLVGSVAFLSPEQILGHEIDERVDVYSLSVLFYYMLSGEKPFQGDDDIGVLYQHVHNPPEDLRERLPFDHDIPKAVIDLIHRGLAKKPSDRPVNASAFLEEFSQAIAGVDIATPHVTGEFNAVSRVVALSSLEPDDPSKRLERRRLQTPMPRPLSSSNLLTQPNLEALETPDQHDAVPSAEYSEPTLSSPRSSRATPWLLAASLVAVLVTAAVLLTQGEPSSEQIANELAAAQALIDQAQLGRAEQALDMIEPRIHEHPERRDEFIAAHDRLQTQRLLSRASLLDESGDRQQAIAAYAKVLDHNPRHEIARARITELRQERSQPAASRATITIASTPSATVLLDKKPLGATPLESVIPSGDHTLELRADGYSRWAKQISLTDGQTLTMEIELDERPPRTPPANLNAPPTAKPLPKPSESAPSLPPKDTSPPAQPPKPSESSSARDEDPSSDLLLPDDDDLLLPSNDSQDNLLLPLDDDRSPEPDLLP